MKSGLKKQDFSIKNIIRVKLDHISLGNFSTCKPARDGVSEIVIDSGPGYRIYYSMIGIKILIILHARTKRTQKKDIEKAIEYLKDYKMRGTSHGKK